MKSLPMRFRLAAISGAFEILWFASTGEAAPHEGTPEWQALKEATSETAKEYIFLYRVHPAKSFPDGPYLPG